MLFEFGNTLGWLAFLSLIPLIIIYLIKPKPTKLKVPSLMFFMKRTNTSTAQSLFRRFQNDLLFLIQLLVLLLLAFSVKSGLRQLLSHFRINRIGNIFWEPFGQFFQFFFVNHNPSSYALNLFCALFISSCGVFCFFF